MKHGKNHSYPYSSNLKKKKWGCQIHSQSTAESLIRVFHIKPGKDFQIYKQKKKLRIAVFSMSSPNITGLVTWFS